eukprot:scpid73826/ scgid5702/ 
MMRATVLLMASLLWIVQMTWTPCQAVRADNQQSCMSQLLHTSHLNSSLIPHIEHLLLRHGLDQATFSTGDYSAVSGLLRHIGIKNPVEIFHIYVSIHNVDDNNNPCGSAATCAATSAGFSCQKAGTAAKRQANGNVQPRTDMFADAIKELQQRLDKLLEARERASQPGAAYTRWGRDDCPAGARVVYSGLAAGAYHRDLGSGANLLCLTSDPIYARYSDYQWGGIIYPTVYKLQNQNEPYSSSYTNAVSAAVRS